MASTVDVVILGSGFRGLWLASEIVKLGWSVTWFQIHSPVSAGRRDHFTFDDWPWQVGPHKPSKTNRSGFMNSVGEFIDDVLKPSDQELAIQILTPSGPLELSGPGHSLSLKKNFPQSYAEISSYFETIKQSQRQDHGQKILKGHTSKFFQRPLGERWCVEWLGSLRRSRAVDTQEWVRNWDGDLFDPESHFWLLGDTLEDVVARAMSWAEKKGVVVKRNAVISDIGIEGRKTTGIESGGGFLNCKRVILACSVDVAKKNVPHLAKHIEPQVEPDSEKFIWGRCGFYMKPETKPHGLCEFSSFVIDPYMPLVGSNLGLLKWKVGENGDSLTVWCRIPFNELKRRSYLMNLNEEIEKNLGNLFPWFIKRLVSVFPFEEYFHSPETVRDDLAIVYDKKNKFNSGSCHLKNVTLMGPGSDRGLELLSQLATEYRLLNQLTEVRQKELKRDRTLHPPRNGEDLVQPK